jgi:hypothetical protein
VLIFRRTVVYLQFSGIVTLCTLPYSAPIKSGLSTLLIGALYGSVQSVTIPENCKYTIVLLKMSTAILETC